MAQASIYQLTSATVTINNMLQCVMEIKVNWNIYGRCADSFSR